MSRQCEIVQDLLPLYVDEICSPSSRELVANHITSCGECAAVLRKLKNSEIEEQLSVETSEVIAKQHRLFRRKSAMWGAILGAAMLIPIIIVFIITLASGGSARNLLVVFASLLFAASLIVVPLVFPRNKFLWTVGLGTICLLLLLAVGITFGEGKWFFVVATSVLFGLTVVLGPIVVNHKAVKPHLGNHKALLCMAADTLLFFIMMLCIGLSTNDGFIGMRIGIVMTVLAWMIFAVIRYIKTNRLIRTGICCIIIGAFLFAMNNLFAMVLGYSLSWPVFEPMAWNMLTIDGNVRWLCLLFGALLGIIFIIIGIIKGGKKR